MEGYSLFKKGIRPEWEDEANKYGGEFFCRKTIEAKDLDEVYETLCLGLIGETVDPGNEICGLRIVDKSRQGRAIYRLEVWFRNADEKIQALIQENLVDCLRRDILQDFRSHGSQVTATQAATGPQAAWKPKK